MKSVICVNGSPRSGKDTAVSFMSETLSNMGVPTMAFSSIDPVKAMLRDFVNLKRKTEADRKLLSVVGDAMQEHSGFRTGYSLFQIKEFFSDKANGVFFLHMREPKLINLMKINCEAEGIRFIRVLLESIRAENVTSNPSDAGVANGMYDARMENNGSLDELREECLGFLVNRVLL